MEDTARRPAVVLTDAARRIHRAAIVVDGHNDLPYKIREHGRSSFDDINIALPQSEFHTDIPRLLEGGVGAQFWAAYVPVEVMHRGGATRYALEQIDLIHRMVRRYNDHFELALTAADVERIRAQGRIAALIGVEGGHAIENSLGVLRMFYALGARYMTLTHNETTSWCDSATDKARHGGLSPFGEHVVHEMNHLGMLVDISHVSADAMRDVLRVSRAPVIASHSAAAAVSDHPRNLPDDVLRQMPANGGVVMVVFYSGFVEPDAARVAQDMMAASRRLRAKHADDDAAFNEAMLAWRDKHPMPSGTIHTVVDHIDHIVQTAGIDHVGLGSDFDGIPQLPEQLEDVSRYPYITQELLNRGYDAERIRKILGGNLLRVMRDARAAAGQ